MEFSKFIRKTIVSRTGDVLDCERVSTADQDAAGQHDRLEGAGAVVFATAIPRGVTAPRDYRFDEFLRKDTVFLFERFFQFLEEKDAHGVLEMDETDKREDRRFVARMEKCFKRTFTGRRRTARIVPTPFFVSSDMAGPVQAADLCIYAINWRFRLPGRGMDAPCRNEIAAMLGVDLADLQYRGQGEREGQRFDSYGISAKVLIRPSRFDKVA